MEVVEELLDAPKNSRKKRKKEKSHRFGYEDLDPRNVRPGETRNQSTAWSESFSMHSMLGFPTSLFSSQRCQLACIFMCGPRAAEGVITRPRRLCLLPTCVRNKDIVWRPRKHMTLGVRFVSSAAWSSRHTDNRNTQLWMVRWQKKEKSKKKWTKLPIEWSAWSLRGDHCWALTRERKWLWQSTRGE